MQRKLYRSDDRTPFGGISNEWRRFWFNDLPPDDAPERVHGDIR